MEGDVNDLLNDPDDFLLGSL